MTSQSQDAILLLQDGTVFKGKALGKIGTTTGEICFNTGMTGYQELYTDPSYYGQIIVNTTAHIGNYGVKLGLEEESEGIKIQGLVCNTFEKDHYSRATADCSLQDYFEKSGIVGISDIDTRQVVRYIRDKGVMNCLISSESNDLEVLKVILDDCPDMSGLELSSRVSTHEPYFLGDPKSEIKIAVVNYGCKKNILRNFTERGCYLKVFNAKAPAQEIIDWNPDGYFISNGPGDPTAMPYALDTVNALLETEKPLFGICMGHQLLGQTQGITCFKMHNGHRGLNHPVKNLVTGKSEITSQNHGFALNPEETNANSAVEVTHVNLNDNSIEGIRLKNKPAFSVQYHPEAAPGPNDSNYLFDQFVDMIKHGSI